jgi:hypothetical protein
LPLELLLNGVEPLALGVERAPGVVVDQPQVPRAVGQLERAPLHLLQILVGALDAGTAKVGIEILGAPGALPA